MIDDPVLLNDWYIVAAARDLADEAMLPVRLWDEELVIWRHNGQVMAWKDYCIAAPNSRWDGSRTGLSNAPITAGATTRPGSVI